MRLRAVLLLSLVLDLALAIALFYVLHGKKAVGENLSLNASHPLAPAPLIKTNIVVRRQNFTWQEIESEDYKAYIKNLRNIGCPESTIRDIIVAEIDALYERKAANDLVTPEQQWWRSDPDPQVEQAAQTQLASLDRERRAMLTELLGPKWEVVTAADLDKLGVHLDGPILSKVSPEVRESLLNIATRAQQRNQNSGGGPLTPGEEARLRQDIRAELAKVLSPEQLEEFLLRYSNNARRLRSELQGLTVTPTEFRKLFHSYDDIDKDMTAYLDSNDAVSIARKHDLEAQRESALKETLTDDRYTLFKYNQDPLFRQSQTIAQRIGVSADVVLPFYRIQQATAQERDRIRNDANLTLEQKAAAFASALSQQHQSLRKLLGEDAYDLYIQNEAE